MWRDMWSDLPEYNFPEVISHMVCVCVCVLVSVCLPSHPHQDYLLTEFNLLNQKISNPSSFLLWVYNQPLSPFLSLPHHLEYITIYLYFLWLLPCLSFNRLCLMSVTVSGSCSARQKQDTFTTMRVCLCPFPSVCASLCVAEWQKVTVSNGPDLKVGVLACRCVLGLGRLVCVFVWVCVYVFTQWWWQLRGNWDVQNSVPSWCPCHFLALFPSLNFPSNPLRGEGEGWNQSPIHRGWPSSPGHRRQSNATDPRISRSKKQLHTFDSELVKSSLGL